MSAPKRKKPKVQDSSKTNSSSQQETEDELSHRESGECMDSWRDDCSGLIDVNKYALYHGHLSDVTFLVGEENTPFRCHKMILALASPVFEAMFYGLLAEKKDTILIPDITPATFKNMLKYIYTNKMSFNNFTVAMDVVTAAEKYCLSHLKSICDSFISKQDLDPQRVWLFLDHAVIYDLYLVNMCCLKYVMNETKLCLSNRSFLEVNRDTVKMILSIKNLAISESQLLEYLVNYCKANAKDKTDENSVLKSFLPYIYFSDFNVHQFNLFLMKHKNILDDKDALAIMQHLLMNANPLPDWCKKNSRQKMGCQRLSIVFSSQGMTFSEAQTPRKVARKRNSEDDLIVND